MADEMPACGKYPGEVTLFTCVWRKQLLLCQAAIAPGPFPSLLDQYEICEVQPQGLLIAADEAKHLIPLRDAVGAQLPLLHSKHQLMQIS